jgi:hypothetical protein
MKYLLLDYHLYVLHTTYYYLSMPLLWEMSCGERMTAGARQQRRLQNIEIGLILG